VQRPRDLLDDAHRAVRFEWAIVQQRLKVDAVDQAHGDEEATLDFADVIDRYDMGVAQPCRGAGFAAEPLLEVGVPCVMGQQHLQRHYAIDGGVVGAPHLAHPAAAKQVDQLVTTERRPVHRLTIDQPAVA
jgi:hypothetical protein